MVKTLNYILYFVFFLCVTVCVTTVGSASKSDIPNLCDGVCWNCSVCRKCHQSMCLEDEYALMFRENCCYRFHKDELTPDCRGICFQEEDVKDKKLEEMKTEMVNTSRQLEETTKQLEEMKIEKVNTRRQLEETTTQLEEMKIEIVNTNRQLEETTKQLKTRDDENDDLRDSLRKLSTLGIVLLVCGLALSVWVLVGSFRMRTGINNIICPCLEHIRL